ncbi:unnamed protein product [Cuscuta epithymum]|uniref:Integrase catalytic domain-containing protein n=1 Tax=Cuscuta epithymum TaxID=186058 RepID=A0AAV0CVI6_9ASTE|nr:unnamed protein product [Cuscuta epithymum]
MSHEAIFSSSSNAQINMAYTLPHARPWIIDSGASEHITCSDVNLFDIVTHTTEPSVKIPNGESVPVHSIGSLYLPNGLCLKRVLYIPKFQCNLLSASRLTSDLSCTLTFFPDFCVLQELSSRKLIGVGRLRDGLYYMESPGSERVALSVSITSDLWHQRLGHASDGKLHHISSLKGFQQSSNFCDPCLRAKQTRLPFPTSTIKTTRCFELIHCDIWGGYRSDSLSGARYFLSIVDDFTRGVWVYLMKNKSEVSQFLIKFCNMVYTQFEQRVKRIRADNGVEFQTNILSDYYGRNGILLETSCTDTPQQNGVVERKHRHILEVARALRFQSGLPINFWGECILTAVYIINRLPSPVIFNKSPFEMLLGKVPSYDHLRVFGCLVYAHDNKQKDKFSERGSPGIFIGYPHGQKAYKIFDLQKQTVYSSRDVVFYEDKFPFKIALDEELEFSTLVQKVCNHTLNQKQGYSTSPHLTSRENYFPHSIATHERQVGKNNYGPTSIQRNQPQEVHSPRQQQLVRQYTYDPTSAEINDQLRCQENMPTPVRDSPRPTPTERTIPVLSEERLPHHQQLQRPFVVAPVRETTSPDHTSEIIDELQVKTPIPLTPHMQSITAPGLLSTGPTIPSSCIAPCE